MRSFLWLLLLTLAVLSTVRCDFDYDDTDSHGHDDHDDHDGHGGHGHHDDHDHHDDDDDGGEGEYSGPYNILVINVDDLRPSLGAYGITEVMSPNIDQLAADGVVFRNAFNQISICGPSRSSFMTSKTPDSLEIWNFKSHIRVAPDGDKLTTIAEYFKNHGYFTTGGGKSFHDELPPAYDGARSWSLDEMAYLPTSKEQCTVNNSIIRSTVQAPARATAVCPIDRPDNQFFEYALADHIINGMNHAVNNSKPFFLWAGFFKPHHPSLMPKRFYDMYNVSEISIPKNLIMNVSEDFSESSLFNYVQGRQADSPMTNKTHTLPYGPNLALPNTWIQTLRAGYFSSITWTDSQIKRVLDELDRLHVRDKTIVVLFADNGISMGEGSKYMKSDNWDISCRIPFIISGPKIPKGKVRFTPIELMDVFPTLASLADLPVAANYSLHGKDITELIVDGDDEDAERYLAFSQFPRCVNISLQSQPWLVDVFPPSVEVQWNCMTSNVNLFVYMGYTVRSRHWRYTEWRKWSYLTYEADWTDAGVVGRELYDHRKNKVYGPSFLEEFETVNVYNRYRSARFVRNLSHKLQERFNNNYF